jgi:small subunit ribosomal protein S6e
MAFKFEIGDPKSKKTFHLEAEAEALNGKIIGEKVSGDEISSQLAGTELEITGTSDKSGFPGKKDIEGTGLRRVLLTRGFGLRKRHKKKKTSSGVLVRGVRIRRTVRANTITSDTVQINLKVIKQGSKSIAEMLGKAEKAAESAAPAAQPAAT